MQKRAHEPENMRMQGYEDTHEHTHEHKDMKMCQDTSNCTGT